MDAAGVGEFADGDGAGWVDAALVDPFLDALEVDGGHIGGEAVGNAVSLAFLLQLLLSRA